MTRSRFLPSSSYRTTPLHGNISNQSQTICQPQPVDQRPCSSPFPIPRPHLTLQNPHILKPLTLPIPQPWQSQIWTTPTGQTIDTEANKFWAYALTAAVAGDIWDILTATPTSENAKVGGRSKTAQDPSEKKQEAKKQGLEKRDEKKRDWRLYRQLVVDGCDLFIPLTIVGWVDLGSRRLGALMVVSTLGAGWGVYERLSR